MSTASITSHDHPSENAVHRDTESIADRSIPQRADDDTPVNDPETEEEEAEDEPWLKYQTLTSSLTSIYRNADATSTFVVSADKMVVGTHNGNIHILDIASSSSVRFYHAHSASISCVSVSSISGAGSRTGTESMLPRRPAQDTNAALQTPAKSSRAPPKAPQKPVTVPNTPSNQIFIASASLDGHVCVASLVDTSDVTLRNFARPVQAVALSPEYRIDRSYLSGGLAGQLVHTVGGKSGVSSAANTTSAAAAASGWLGSIGLGTNTGKDNILHSGEGSISAIKYSRNGKYVAWINEHGIKVMRSDLKLGNQDASIAWKRFAHIDRPTRESWDDIASIHKGHIEWHGSEDARSDDVTSAIPRTPTLNAAAQKRYEVLLIGWGDTAWIIHVQPGDSATRHGAERAVGRADIIKKFTFDDCILSGISLYTPTILLVLAYRTVDDNDNPITPSNDRGSRRKRHNGLLPELRMIEVATGEEVESDTITVDRYATLTASDYHLATLYNPFPNATANNNSAQRGAFESFGESIRDVGTGIRDMGTGIRDISSNATRMFSSAASIRSVGNSIDYPSSSMLSPTSKGVPARGSPAPSLKEGSSATSTAPGLKIYIHSPYDLVIGTKRDLNDHYAWLIDHCKYELAWELIAEYPSVVGSASDARSERSPVSTPTRASSNLVDFFGERLETQSMTSGDHQQQFAANQEQQRIGDLWIEQLIKAEDWTRAGQVAGKTLGRSSRWAHWVNIFAQAQKLSQVTPYIPDTDGKPSLPAIVYDTALCHYVESDRPRFGELIGRWDAEALDITTVIDAIQEQLQTQQVSEDSIEDGIKGRDWRILMNGLAKLQAAGGMPREALRCHIQLKNPDEAMSLIRDHRLINAVSDQLPGLLTLRLSEDELRHGDINVLRKQSADIVQLLVDEARDGVVSSEVIVSQLEADLYAPFLHFYFQSLWSGPMRDPDKNYTRAERAAMDAKTREGRLIVDVYADRVIALFAVYERRLLLEVFQLSNTYNLDRATEICESRHYVPELVYIFSKTGQTRRALFLIIKELGDVSQAIAFTKEHPDLWTDLLEYSMDKPSFILALISEVGTAIDPVKLVKSIPAGLEIDGLKQGIHKLVTEHDIQYSISQGAARVFHGEVASSMGVLRTGQKKAIKFEVKHARQGATNVEVKVNPVASSLDRGTLKTAGVPTTVLESKAVNDGKCVQCRDVFSTDEQDFLLGFACGHVYHLPCLLKSTNVSETTRNTLQSLENRSKGEGYEGGLMRSVNSKISDAQTIRSAVKDGCPECLSDSTDSR